MNRLKVISASVAIAAINQFSIANNVIIPLGPVAPGVRSSGYSINNLGHVAGTSYFSPGFSSSIATSWAHGSATALDVRWSKIGSHAYGINDLNQIVGGTYINGQRPFIWQDGEMTILQGFGHALDINNAGVAVGWGNDQPVMWIDDDMITLDTLGSTGGAARAINESGMVVGVINPLAGDQYEQAVLWRNGVAALLGAPENGGSLATDINNDGIIVGGLRHHDDELSSWEAFMHDGTQMKALGTWGYRSSAFWAINSHNQIIGHVWNERPDDEFIAFLYDNGSLTFLRDLLPQDSGWSHLIAQDINDVGQITGYGTYQGQMRGFVMTIPAPGGLVLIGFIACCGSGRRRRC